ncbi:MFS transporter [Bergeriella denitrificans]|uniref:4-hydroxybenzoate transporter PcaK n=1 Tax=Bergeriella denitrificans TaxID=494 RepID=A0A378UIY5_BERDE|nr:MFS transporter [Bergeriella denitrificans]STZ76693.1 4-hydroxybenzoate transporter PcaK [Bergeriella denitrificans]
MDLRQKIAESPMSGYQWLVVALAVLLNMLDGFDVLAVAFTAKSIQAELGLDGAHIGTLMSAGLLGMTLGSVFLAPLADRFGRRPLLIFSTALSALGMLMTYFAHSVESIALWRVVTGLGVGGILPCTNVIVSEYSNKKWRGLAIAIYASGFGIGAMLGGMSAVVLQDSYGWRSVFLIGAVLTLAAVAVLMALLPESVEYLLNKRPADARARLDKITAKMGLGGDWAFPEAAQQVKKAKVSVLRLFEPNYIKTTLLIWVAFITVMAAYYFISSWTPALLEEAGMAKTQSQTVGMAISIGGAIGSLVFGVLVSRWTPRAVLIAFALAAAGAVFAFLSAGSLALALAFAVLLGALMNGCIAGLYTINPTLYEADFRNTGVGVTIGVGRLGSILSPMIAGGLLDAGWAKNDLYGGAALVIALAAVAVFFLKPREQG